MKNPNPKSECVLITHIVNPHQFYYKYINHIANGTFSKFDFEIQLYGNELYAQKTHPNGYVPMENELVIFFNIIFNKWVRGRVISIGQEIIFWCVDNGVWEKLTAPHVLPLAEQFHKDMNFVHLGGLSLLPIEKTWNVETEEVENQVSKEWDEKSINVCKGIVSTSKTFMFTEEFELGNHTFGLLAIESKTTSRKEVNQILLDLNSAAYSHKYEDLCSYVHDALLKIRLCKSILGDSSLLTSNLNNNVGPTKAVHRGYPKYGSEMSSLDSMAPSEYFDDSASRHSSDISTTLEPDAVPNGSGRQSKAKCDEDLKPTISKYRSEKSTGKVYGRLRDSVSLTTSTPTNAHTSVSTNAQTSVPTNAHTSVPTNTHTSKERCHQSGSQFSSEECHLRTCKRDDTANVRQPLRSTMDWIKSMSKSKSSDNAYGSDKPCASSTTNLNGIRPSDQISPTSSTTSKKNILDALTKQVDTTVQNSAHKANSRYGIPAGYDKGCLNTFGGVNRK